MANENDFLDNLRKFNKRNINQNPEARENFFKSLMVCADNAPSYLANLSDGYSEAFEKEYEGNIAKEFLLSSLYGNEVRRQLTDHLIQDRENCLFIEGRSSAYAVTYCGSVKGMRKLVEKAPDHFGFFKESLLRGLIVRYCNDFASGRNAERLNKLLAIYAEHLRNLEPTEEIPMVIDEEFASELKAKKKYGTLDSKDSLRTVDKLIDRKYPVRHSWDYSPYEFESKRGAK